MPEDEPGEAPPEFESEAEFRVRLASILRGYGYGVYHHDPDPGVTQMFSAKGARGYVDLYLRTPGSLSWWREIPALGIECKLAKNLGWVREAGDQVRRYAEEATTATYVIDGRVAPSPKLFLVCTQHSWYEGHLYLWMPERFQRASPEARDLAWWAMTEEFDRSIMPFGAVLRGTPGLPHFFSNVEGGPIRRYEVAP